MNFEAVPIITQNNNYDLFNYLSVIRINPKQFEIFRHILFGRVFLTIPSIGKALNASLLEQDHLSAQMCFQNLQEELCEPNHQILMHVAFNFVATNVFGLKSTSLLECYNNPILSEEIIYRYTVDGLYSNDPFIASMCQELSSGGTSCEDGMMAKMYGVFLNIFYTNNMNISNFKTNVLPYFKAHLSIDDNLNLNFDENSVEYQHGLRAVENFHRKYDQPNQSLLLAFTKAQNLLFNSTLELIRQHSS